MRLKALRIERYGPLSEFAAREFGDFTLVFGPNEQGKTLLIDAIIKLLFKRDLGRRVKFGNLRRVEEEPEGFVVLDFDGVETRLKRGESLARHVPVTATDFRNIFVVRDSDATIPDEHSYYTHVSEGLAGLKTSEIHRITRVIQKKGPLTNNTSSAELADTAETGHLASKVERARECIERIQQVGEKLEASGFEQLEREMAEAAEGLSAAERELALLHEAHEFESYARDEERLRQLKAILGSLDEVAGANDGDLNVWREAERDHQRLCAELVDLRETHDRQRRHLDEIDGQLSEIRAAASELEQDAGRFDDIMTPRMKRCEHLLEEQSRRRSSKGLWKAVAAVSLVLLSGVAVVGLQHSTPLFWVLCAVFSLSSVLAVGRLFEITRGEGRLLRGLDAVRHDAARLGIDAVSIEDLLRHRSDLGRSVEAQARVKSEASVRHGTCKNDLDTTWQRIGADRDRIADLENIMAGLRMKSGWETLADYHAALARRNRLATERQSIEAVLTTSLGALGEGGLQGWESKVQRHIGRCGRPAIAYDAEREHKVRARHAELDRQLKHTRERFEAGRRALHEVEIEVGHSHVLDAAVVEARNDVVCRTTAELDRTARALRTFIDEVEQRKGRALQALTILEEIEGEEKAKVIQLFGKDRPVSAYYESITGGRHREVRFDPVSGSIDVCGADGKWIAAEKLSGGAHDQLYLAIRLSVAQSLLEGRRGFFILDDPFIKSDSRRLASQMSILRRIREAGWQVIYFSAKQEVLDALQPDISMGRVGLIRLGASDSPVRPGEPSRPHQPSLRAQPGQPGRPDPLRQPSSPRQPSEPSPAPRKTAEPAAVPPDPDLFSGGGTY